MNGPAPTGALLNCRALRLMAVGEPMNGIRATACGNTAFLALSVIFSVTRVDDVHRWMRLAWAARRWPPLAGS